MTEQVTEQKEEERIFKPFAFVFGLGNCADSDAAKDVSKDTYGEEISFMLAGIRTVKHAP